MTIENSSNTYAKLLKEQGNYVITMEGIDWFDYSGFMTPAYLPHCVPEISKDTAQKVLKKARTPFVRWDCDFDKINESQWWYVLKRGKWDISEIRNKKKRWAVRQGIANFKTRPLERDEVLLKCPEVANAAAKRYKGGGQVENKEILSKRIYAGQKVTGVLEYFGCLDGDRLVSYCESYIQKNAIWWTTIRHDPEYLNKYSGYGLINGLLDYYLNHKIWNIFLMAVAVYIIELNFRII